MNLASDEAMSVLVQEPGPARDSKDKEIEGALISFAWHLKKQGLRESTVKEYCKILRQLARGGVNLEDPEAVKEALAKSNRSGEWKALIAHAYSAYLKAKGKHWDPPRFDVARKIPFIPLESELDALIAGCGPKTATLLQLLKETGMRIGEALRLTWSSVDLERRVIVLNQPEKNSNPRIFKISPRLVSMLSMLPKSGERVFPTSYESVKTNFKNSRRRLAERLNNPRLLSISFHTFRHWKATMEYHKTKDLLHVKELLGHKNVDNTMLYIQIERALFSETDAEFTVRVAKTPDEVKELLEAGFEYVCEKDGLMFFRKRK
ncbi:MAG: site-specific integrase [Thermofilum sp.]